MEEGFGLSGLDETTVSLISTINLSNFLLNLSEMAKEDMEEEIGLSGLDERTVSLISGLSVLCVVLVIITLGIIGFFVKVRFINCQCIYIYSKDIGKLVASFSPEFYSNTFQTFKARREMREKKQGSTRESSISEEPTSKCPQGEARLVGWLASVP